MLVLILSAFLTTKVLLAQEIIRYDTPDLPTIADRPQLKQSVFTLGSCRIVFNPVCPDNDITFHLYTQKNPFNAEQIFVTGHPGMSNLSSSQYNPQLPTKIIIHGYNSDMMLPVLVEIRKEYLRTNNFNIFAVNWGSLAQAPCYPGAVWNIRHVGDCTAQLIQRIREFGATDIHVIGFSLGAQVTNYLSIALRPYRLPRITGLDPALPAFVTNNLEEKLDKSDAEFVDVYHTNAFIQGKVEESGHVDFYINGGVIQPGCWAEQRFFACNHHRAPLYFAESINTEKGFWGWPCPDYMQYLLGRCPPVDPQIIMGDHVDFSARGVYLVITESVAPFAVGKYTGPNIEIILKNEESNQKLAYDSYVRTLLRNVDEGSAMKDIFFSINATLQDKLTASFADDFFY